MEGVGRVAAKPWSKEKSDLKRNREKNWKPEQNGRSSLARLNLTIPHTVWTKASEVGLRKGVGWGILCDCTRAQKNAFQCFFFSLSAPPGLPLRKPALKGRFENKSPTHFLMASPAPFFVLSD